jgi:hypothetical protein
MKSATASQQTLQRFDFLTWGAYLFSLRLSVSEGPRR